METSELYSMDLQWEIKVKNLACFMQLGIIILLFLTVALIGDHVLIGLWHEKLLSINMAGYFSIILSYLKSIINIVTKGLRQML